MPLGHREDHRLDRGARIELRRANQVADVLDKDQVETLVAELGQTLVGHAGVQMAHAARVDLDRLGPVHAHRLGINRRVDVGLDHADLHLAREGINRPREEGRLARARRRHEVDEQSPLLLHASAQLAGIADVGGKDVLFDLDDAYVVHGVSFTVSCSHIRVYVMGCRAITCFALPNKFCQLKNM